jgi:hypothetical protein
LSLKAAIFLSCLGLLAVASAISLAQKPAPKGGGAATPDSSDVWRIAISGVKEAERALYLYERIERVESRKDPGDPTPQSVKVSRVVPAGTGIAKITLGADGKPPDVDAYRSELNKLLNSLTWAAAIRAAATRRVPENSRKKQKDRDDLIEAMHERVSFHLSRIRSLRDGRMLEKYSMEPNPSTNPPTGPHRFSRSERVRSGWTRHRTSWPAWKVK